MPEQVTEYLRNAKGLTDEQRADLWDAFYQSKDPAGFTAALRKIDAPDSVRADLWDMKAGGEVTTPAPTTSEAPPSEGGSLGGVPGFMAGAGRAIGRGAAQVAPYLDPMSIAAKTTRAAGQAVGAGTLPQTPVELMSAGVTGAPAMQPPAPGDPNAGVQGAGATAGNIAMMMAGGKGAGALAQKVAGPVGRAMTSPAVWGGVAGADTLRRTGSPLAAAEAGAGTYLAGKAGGAMLGKMGGALGRFGRLLGMRGQGAARAASPAATPAAAAPRPPGPTLATPAPAPAAPTPGAQGMQALMQRPPAGPAATPAQLMRPPTQTPIGQARGRTPSLVPRATTTTEDEALLKLSEKLATQPAITREMAKDVVRWRLTGSSMPAKSPGQIATGLVDKYQSRVEGLTAHQARKFADMIVEAAGI